MGTQMRNQLENQMVMRAKHNFFFAFLSSLLIVAAMAISQTAGAQNNEDELLSVTSEGTSKATSQVEATREIQSKALSGAAREQVIEMIGEKRYAKNKPLVENRIIREAAKFVPFVQPGDIAKLPDGSWKMKVDLKISVGSLRKMVIDTGLLTDADTPVTILPMIAFTDRVKAVSYRWWMGDTRDESRKSLIEWAKIVQLGLHKELMHQGFHLQLPLEGALSNAIPPAFRVDRASSQDLKQLGEYLGISMALRGDVRVKDSKENAGGWQIQARLEVIPVLGGRTVAEVSRTFETDPGPADIVVRKKLEKEISEMAKDLSTQVLEAWTRGTLAATTIRLAVRGQLSPKQLSDFRTQLSKSMRDIKAMRERLFEPNRVVFEVDYAASPEEFRDKLKGLALPGFTEKLVVDAELGAADGVNLPFTLEVRPKSL
ncbi:hypothetical protein BH10BDE1_BH10BDE1_14590 [soil metagenome]